MGLTICTFAGALRSFGRWLAGGPIRTTVSTPACPSGLRLHTTAGRAHVAWPPTLRTGAVRRPLRVLRVVDAEHAPSTAGRMVISGRMADVCAELDRLAALEAAAA
jgi:hypothetical protein